MDETQFSWLFACGGGLGALVRYLVAQSINRRFPLATLLVNVIGSLLLGATIALAADGLAYRFVTGFCGGFTTFSSFASQSLALHRQRGSIAAAINVTANLVLCVGAVALGLRLAAAMPD